MDGLTFAAEIVKALSWPILAGAFILGYRKRIGLLLDSLKAFIDRAKKLKAFGAELEAAERATNVVVAAKSAEIEDASARIDNAPPAEQQLLLRRLTEAVGEVERLKVAQRALSIARAEVDEPAHAARLIASMAQYSGQLSPGRTSIMTRFAKALGKQWVLDQARNGHLNELTEALTRVAREVRAGNHFAEYGLNSGSLTGVINAGLFRQDDTATSMGVVELIRAAGAPD